MKRSVTTLTLLFTSVSAILGSGWLFTSYYAGTIAGPASLLAWVIAGLAIMFIVLAFMLVGNGLRDALDTKAIEEEQVMGY